MGRDLLYLKWFLNLNNGFQICWFAIVIAMLVVVVWIFSFVFTTPGYARGLLLALYPGITPDNLGDHLWCQRRNRGQSPAIQVPYFWSCLWTPLVILFIYLFVCITLLLSLSWSCLWKGKSSNSLVLRRGDGLVPKCHFLLATCPVRMGSLHNFPRRRRQSGRCVLMLSCQASGNIQSPVKPLFCFLWSI